MRLPLMSTSIRVILVLSFLNLPLLRVMSVWAEEARQGWMAGWKKVLSAAEKEGEVSVYAVRSIGNYPKVTQAFQKKYPNIKLKLLSVSSVQHRVMAERRAGKHLVDLIWTSPSRLYNNFYRGRVIEPIASVLILPEVTDSSKWWQGKHHYVDLERQYIFVFESSIYGAPISYNTNLINPDELKSIWDIVQPKWKGKIEAYDIVAGRGGNHVNFIFRHPQIGPEFLRKLYGEMNATLFRDHRQAADWLAVGKFALCFHCRGVLEAKEKGLPVDDFAPYHFREKVGIGAGNGAIVRMKNAPHPNAGKVFLNWLLSRDGQIAFRIANKIDPDKDSMRVDLPHSVLPEIRRRDDVDYIWVHQPHWIDYGALGKFGRKVIPRYRR